MPTEECIKFAVDQAIKKCEGIGLLMLGNGALIIFSIFWVFPICTGYHKQDQKVDELNEDNPDDAK